MRPYHRLSFVVSVLTIAGAICSLWAYYAKGISGLKTSVQGWLIGLVAAVLLNLFLRRFREHADQGAGETRRRWLNENSIGWTIVAVGSAVGAYAFGLAKGITVAAVAILMVLTILLYARFAARHEKGEGQTTK